MLISIFTLLSVLGILVILSYHCTITTEYRNMVYSVKFKSTHELFGTITVGKTYSCWRNAYYHKWTRTEVFHFIDDKGVNHYISIYDDVLDNVQFEESKPLG